MSIVVTRRECCLCGGELTGKGHNAQPVKAGLCCFDCNYKIVVIARLDNLVDKLHQKNREEE
jgi:hypothetical protein